MSTKFISKKQLTIQLSKLKTPDNPHLILEQYPISGEVAAELLYMAGFEHNDLQGRNILDLGTGSGRLAIGASLLGAEHVTGIDIDRDALQYAKENAKLLDVKIAWRLGDIKKITGKYDTIVMNPPYGTRTNHLDKIFLTQSFQLAPIIYSIHKTTTRHFIHNMVKKSGHKVTDIRETILKIPHMFDFHKQKWRNVQVDLYRITE